MKSKTKKKIENIAVSVGIKLLEGIQLLAEMAPVPFESKYEHQKRLRKLVHGYPAYAVDNGFYRLRKQGLIKPKQNNQSFSYQLTLDGYQKLLISKINRLPKTKNEKNATIIIFDVPEAKRRHRMFLRRLLLKNGFINLQKSVMIAPHDLPKEFIELLNELKLRQNVTFIKGQVEYP